MAQRTELDSVAKRHLSAVDPKLSSLIIRLGNYTKQPQLTDYGPLNYLVRAVIGQQLSKHAARTIFSRLQVLLGSEHIDANKLIGLSEASLREIGLSDQKASYIKGICLSICDGNLKLDVINTLGDDQVIEALTRTKGIGRWTAEMYLIFYLRRPDVLPCDDAGIQKGLQIAYQMKSRPSAEYVARVGRKWKPYRTAASLLLWMAVDTLDGKR